MKRLIIPIAAALFLLPSVVAADTDPIVESDACEDVTVRNVEPGWVLRLDYHDLAHAAELPIESDPQTWVEIRPGGLWLWVLYTAGGTQGGEVIAEGTVDLAVCPFPSPDPTAIPTLEPTPAPSADPTPKPTLPETDTIR